MSKHKEYKIGNIEVKTGNDIRFYKHGLEADLIVKKNDLIS